MLAKARQFVSACKDMALYMNVRMSKVVEGVEQDLNSTRTELTRFLNDLQDYLHRCNYYLEQFDITHDEFRGEIEQRSHHLYSESEKHAAMGKLNLLVTGGSGLAAVTTFAGGVAVGLGAASSIMYPPVAIILATAMVTSASALSGLAGAFCLETKISIQKKKVFVEAAQKITNIYGLLSSTNGNIVDMTTELETVREKINGVADIPGITEIALGDDRSKLKRHVEELGGVMEYILKQAEKFLT